MNPIRSFLFIPGNRSGWIDKAADCGADAIILDLEDSVPPAQKAESREIVRSKLADLAERKQRNWVRINRSPHLYDFDDMLAVVGPHLEGIAAPKPNGPEDIETLSAMLSEAEYRNAAPVGSTRLLPILETARPMQLAFEVAQHPRVAAITGLSVKNGDVARALGIGWTPEGRESLFLKSRVVMAARAACKQPIGGLWQQVHDLEGLARAAAADRDLGMSGQLLLHPSNVSIVNRIYSPSAAELAYCRGLIEAVEAAQAAGRASTVYEGEHVDIAHANTARQIIDLARTFEI